MDNRPGFISSFIEMYRNFPCLWKVTDNSYKNRNLKDEAYRQLLAYYRTVIPTATIDTVKKKINNLKGTFRKELKKVKKQKSGASADDNYVSHLWYFDLMMFTADQELPRNSISNEYNVDVDPNETFCEDYSMHLSLSPSSLPSRSPQPSLSPLPSRSSQPPHSPLPSRSSQPPHSPLPSRSTQPSHLPLPSRSSQPSHSPMPSRSPLLSSHLPLPSRSPLMSHSPLPPRKIIPLSPHSSTQILETAPTLSSKRKRNLINEAYKALKEDDEFDGISLNVACKLRRMNEEQRLYAEALINKIIMYGVKNRLQEETNITGLVRSQRPALTITEREPIENQASSQSILQGSLPGIHSFQQPSQSPQEIHMTEEELSQLIHFKPLD